MQSFHSNAMVKVVEVLLMPHYGIVMAANAL